MIELTDKQQEYWDLYQKHGDYSKAAKKAGISRQVFTRAVKAVKAKRAKAGVSDNFDLSKHVGEGYSIKGVSSLVDADGEAKIRWIKTDIDKERQLEALRVFVESLKEDIKPTKAIPLSKNKKWNSDLINTYVITDYHLGMVAWPEETGDDWNMDIAEDTLVKWFSAAIAASPTAESAIFLELGDFAHYDGINAVTPMSGHLLDTDTRFQKLIRVMIRVTRKIISMLLAKYKHVTYIAAEGNHDLSSSMWMRELFHSFYENEKRLTVDRSPDPYYAYEHGKTLICAHHGHLRNFKGISETMAAKFREPFGRTKHSFIHMGHYHHIKVEENNLFVVEQHRTLSGKDAYSSRHGHDSGRDAQVITYHKKFGDVGRLKISYEMLQ